MSYVVCVDCATAAELSLDPDERAAQLTNFRVRHYGHRAFVKEAAGDGRTITQIPTDIDPIGYARFKRSIAAR